MLKKLLLDNVLLLNDDKSTEVGSPKVAGAAVEAGLLENVKDRTVLVFHKRRRKHSRKRMVTGNVIQRYNNENFSKRW